MQSWQRVWREGFAPQLSTEVLEGLATALREDDVRLKQGQTTEPPPLMSVQDWPCEGGCLIGYCGVLARGGFGTAIIQQVEEFFADACFEADRRMGEPAVCRYLLNQWDCTSRPLARAEMLAEVERELQLRRAPEAA